MASNNDTPERRGGKHGGSSSSGDASGGSPSDANGNQAPQQRRDAAAAKKKRLRLRIPFLDIFAFGIGIAAIVGLFITKDPSSKSARGARNAGPSIFGWIAGATGTGRDAASSRDGDWILDRDSWERGVHLLPEPILRRVKRGDYWFHVVPEASETLGSLYSRAFWDATSANDGRFAVDAATCALEDAATGITPSFYFGFPFPKVSGDDPSVACKIAWNFEAANQIGNGGGAKFQLTQMDAKGEVKRAGLALEGQSYLGRAAGPIENPEALRNRWRSQELDGASAEDLAGFRIRANDPNIPDKAWRFDAKTRRVVSIPEARRSDAIPGFSIFGDDANCFFGKVESHRWRVVGEGNVLAPLASTTPLRLVAINGTRSEVDPPQLPAVSESRSRRGAPWLIVDSLLMVPRPVWLLEATSVDPEYHFGKVVLYVDKELYRAWWKLVSNRAGEVFYNAMCVHYWATSADGTFSAPALAAVVGVNEKANKACVAGRPRRAYLESGNMVSALAPSTGMPSD